jgi:dsDNA-specific endonuclease/ATPase MutS2
MKTSILRIVFALAAASVALGIFAADLQAQPRAARGRIYTKAEVERIIKRVEDRSDKFKKEFDKALDRSRLNNSNREDQLNQYAKDLEKNTDELRREFDRRDAWVENKDEVKKCLSTATKINVAMRNRRLGPKVESTWAALRFELNTLAQVYNLPPVGSPGY